MNEDRERVPFMASFTGLVSFIFDERGSAREARSMNKFYGILIFAPTKFPSLVLVSFAKSMH